jgi:hypothetical protein
MNQDRINILNNLFEKWNGAQAFDSTEIEDAKVTAFSTAYFMSNHFSIEPVSKAHSFALLLSYFTSNYVHLTAQGVAVDQARDVSAFRAYAQLYWKSHRDEDEPTKALYCRKDEVLLLNVHDEDEALHPLFHIQARLDADVNVGIDAIIIDADPDEEDIPFEDYEILNPQDQPIPGVKEAFETILRDEDYQIGATYFPVIMHMNFIKTGHHFRDDGLSAKFYLRQLRSLQVEDRLRRFVTFNIIYNAFHWQGPYTQYRYTKMLNDNDELPRALAIKLPLVPAGTAVVCSTYAVMKGLTLVPQLEPLSRIFSAKISYLKGISRDIKTNYIRFFIRSDLFGYHDALDTDYFKSASDVATNMAPVAQAFIDVLCKGSEFTQVKALKKHADANPAVYKMFTTLFKALDAAIKKSYREKTVRAIVTDEFGDQVLGIEDRITALMLPAPVPIVYEGPDDDNIEVVHNQPQGNAPAVLPQGPPNVAPVNNAPVAAQDPDDQNDDHSGSDEADL